MDKHPKQWLLLLGLLVWQLLPATAQQTTQMSLQEAVQYALNNSTVLKNAQINIADAEAQIIERRAWGLPQLTGNANFQRYLKVPSQPLPDAFLAFFEQLGIPVQREASFLLKNNFNAGLMLDAMLFDGSYFVGLQAARAYRLYTAQEYTTQQRGVRNAVVDAYLPALIIDKNLEILDKNLTNLEKLLGETKELYKAGFSEQLDIDRLELSAANLRTERENLQRQRDVAIAALKFTINFPQDGVLALSENLNEMAVEATDEELNGAPNLAARPEVTQVDMAISLNEYNVRLNRSGYLPALRLLGAYQQSYQGNNKDDGFWAPSSYVGLNLSIPIFDGFDKKAKIDRARLDLELAKIQRYDLERSIQLEVNTARTNYTSAKQRFESQKRNVALADRIYQTTQVKYREGVGSSLEVTQAEQSLYDSQRNYMQGLYDLLKARTELSKALGKQ